jgi:hypothetical protein
MQLTQRFHCAINRHTWSSTVCASICEQSGEIIPAVQFGNVEQATPDSAEDSSGGLCFKSFV